MLWGRTTYEMMESAWPAVARGDVDAPPSMREWALKLEAKPKYVVSATRSDFPWTNSHHVVGDLHTAVQERSEEHTSELQSLMRISYAVFCLKKKKKRKEIYTRQQQN